MVKYLENENFKDIIKEGIWLVDFYADWCGPCKMLAPILEDLDVNVLKVNVDQHESLAQEFAVMSIPSLFYFKNGENIHHEVGFRTKEEILNNLKNMEN